MVKTYRIQPTSYLRTLLVNKGKRGRGCWLWLGLPSDNLLFRNIIHIYKDFETSLHLPETTIFGILFAHLRHRIPLFSMICDQSDRIPITPHRSAWAPRCQTLFSFNAIEEFLIAGEKTWRKGKIARMISVDETSEEIHRRHSRPELKDLIKVRDRKWTSNWRQNCLCLQKHSFPSRDRSYSTFPFPFSRSLRVTGRIRSQSLSFKACESPIVRTQTKCLRTADGGRNERESESKSLAESNQDLPGFNLWRHAVDNFGVW